MTTLPLLGAGNWVWIELTGMDWAFVALSSAIILASLGSKLAVDLRRWFGRGDAG